MTWSDLDAMPPAELPWLQDVLELHGRMALCERCHRHLIGEDKACRGSLVHLGPPEGVIAVGEQCVSCGLVRSGILERVLDRVE